MGIELVLHNDDPLSSDKHTDRLLEGNQNSAMMRSTVVLRYIQSELYSQFEGIS